MTSTQRHEARYQRRKAKRKRLKRERAENFTPESVFTFETLFKAGKKACNGVRWKQSTQNFELHLFSRTAKNRQSLLNGTWKSDRYFHFTLHERGKTREIDAPRIVDRQVHKVLTQRLLIPIYKPYMIYNNGASMKGKGLMFSMNVLKDDLKQHVRKYGMRGEVLILDFKKFFPTASHDVVFERHDKLVQDARLKDVLMKAGMLKHGEKGLPLGVELNQAEMVTLPTGLDNYIKCQLGLVVGHYMDDYYVLLPPNTDSQEIIELIKQRAVKDGMTLNIKKTKAVPITKPFRFCKAKFTVTQGGGIIVNGARAGAYKVKEKLNAFKKKGTNMEYVRECVQSYLAYYERYDSHGKWLKIMRTFYAIYGFDARQTLKYRESKCST